MSKYVISCESTVDTDPAKLAELNVPVVHLTARCDDEALFDDMQQATAQKLFDEMRLGKVYKTSQPAPTEYEGTWTPYLKDGFDVLHISLSSAISGSVNSARLAAAQLSEKYPERKIITIDSLDASGGYGMLIIHACRMRDEGKSIDELAQAVDELKLYIQHWFTTDEVRYLARSGRLGKASAFVADVLQIKPVLNMDNLGRLIPREKVKGRKKALKSIADHLIQQIDIDRTPFMGLTHSDCIDDANYVISLVHEKFPDLPVVIWSIGVVIGSHTGPGVVSVYFIAKEPRVD